MATYFIDYENTHSLNGINELTKEDSVIIFYSDNANSLSFDIHQEILKCEAYIEYKLVKVGTPNALDFQLSTYLGYLIKEKEISAEPIFIPYLLFLRIKDFPPYLIFGRKKNL